MGEEDGVEEVSVEEDGEVEEAFEVVGMVVEVEGAFVDVEEGTLHIELRVWKKITPIENSNIDIK